MFFFLVNLRNRIKKHPPFHYFVWLFVIFVVLFVLHFVFFIYAEEVDWREALWQTWQTFTTVGYGNRPAETWLGRLNTMLFSTLGIAVMGTLFAACFDMKIYFNNLKRYGQMKNPFRDGYVVIHYPGEDNFATFVNEIRSIEPDVGICVLDPNLEEIPSGLSHIGKLHLVRGSCTERENFEKAGLRENKVALVFSPQISVSGADAMTKTVVHLVGKFLEGSKTRLMHMLNDAKNAWMFADEKSLQIIEDLNILAVVQECSDPYSSQMVESMLRNTVGPSIRTVEPTRIIGWTWGRFCQALLDAGKDASARITPLGLVRNGQAISCTPPDEVILAGDLISAISANDVDWHKVEKRIESA